MAQPHAPLPVRSPRWMQRAPLCVLSLLSSLLAACASTGDAGDRLAMTRGIETEYHLGAQQKQRLQYYLSSDIRLVAGNSSGSRGVRDGSLLDQSSQSVSEIRVRAGTPGVVVGQGPGWMAVSFEPDSFLYFITAPDQPDMAGQQWIPGAYYLNIRTASNGVGYTPYRNQQWRVSPESAAAHLLVDRISINAYDGSSHLMPGRKLAN